MEAICVLIVPTDTPSWSAISRWVSPLVRSAAIWACRGVKIDVHIGCLGPCGRVHRRESSSDGLVS